MEALAAELKVRLADPTGSSALAGYKAQLAQVEAKLERLTDALIDRLIEQDAFVRRRDALYDERRRLRGEIEAVEAQQLSPEDIEAFLQHVLNVAETFEIGDDSAKREVVILASSNRKMNGKNLELEPSNWLQRLENTSQVDTSSRSSSEK